MSTGRFPPRVVVLDDDEMIRRFVTMALEELPIELVSCDTVAAAMLALHAAPGAVPLVITDLMLRGETGFDLLNTLKALPAGRPAPLVAVFSAGMVADLRKQLSQFEVWRLLPKPIGVLELEACVKEALLAWEAAGHPLASAEPEEPTERQAPQEARLDGSLEDHERQAVQLNFAGDLALFTGYRAACRAQWPQDVVEGDAAVSTRDAPALRRLGHSLKTVLRLLGQPEIAQQAQALDEASARADWPTALPLWHTLRLALLEASGQRPA